MPSYHPFKPTPHHHLLLSLAQRNHAIVINHSANHNSLPIHDPLVCMQVEGVKRPENPVPIMVVYNYLFKLGGVFFPFLVLGVRIILIITVLTGESSDTSFSSKVILRMAFGPFSHSYILNPGPSNLDLAIALSPYPGRGASKTYTLTLKHSPCPGRRASQRGRQENPLHVLRRDIHEGHDIRRHSPVQGRIHVGSHFP